MKKVIAIIAFAMLLMLAGCGEGQSIRKYGYSDEIEVPDITVLAKDIDPYNYYYLVDNKTGVVYLQFDGFRRAGITVMLNPDGTPVTIDQIRKEANE